ncbi:MAG TPA: hypothetical protein VFW85_07270 [Gaiellaceae bacterium]|nr:hypothetical protein [Gaiellaceae bacterium]
MNLLLLLVPLPWLAFALVLARVGGRSVLGTADGSAIPPQSFGLRAFQTR